MGTLRRGQQDLYTVKEVRCRTGLSRDQLRDYEEQGLLGKVLRSGPGGRRLYTDEQLIFLERLALLRQSLPFRLAADLAAQGLDSLPARTKVPRFRIEQLIVGLEARTDPLVDAARLLHMLLRARRTS